MTCDDLVPRRVTVTHTETPGYASVLEQPLTTFRAYIRRKQVRRTRPAPQVGQAPPHSPARATPPQRAALSRQRGPARIYMALFWSRALIGRPRVTTCSRAAGQDGTETWGRSASGSPEG